MWILANVNYLITPNHPIIPLIILIARFIAVNPRNMGPDALEILLPVMAVVVVFIFVVGAFFYFFRFDLTSIE